jgi:molybdopterin-guanine dinucleotide biosynthesis protein A
VSGSTRTVAIVLAGGAGRRFGSDKLSAPVAGRPMLDHVVETARGIADEVLVVLAPDDERRLPDDVRLVRDARPHEGPLAGLAAGLASVPDRGAVAIVLAGDMPAARPAVLCLLIGAVEDGAAAAVLHDGITARPLPSAYAVAPAREAVERLLATGERRLRALPAALDATEVPSTAWRGLDPDGMTLRDIDRPEDLDPGAAG